MSGLTAFVGVTGLVITGFLVLARLSQRLVDDVEAVDAGDVADGNDPEEERGSTTLQEGDGSLAGVPPDSSVPGAPPSESGVEGAGSTPSAPRESTTPGPGAAQSPNDGTPAASSPNDGKLAVPTHRDGTGDAARGVESMSAGALLANVALTQGLFGALLAGAAWYFGVPGSALGLWGGSVEGPTAVAVGVAFGLALWVGNEVASALADAAGAAYDEGLRALLAPETAGGWAVLLGATLPIIAVVEEFLFRAAAVGATGAAFPVSPWALAVVSSAAFALGHGAQGRVGVVVTGALGFALAAGFVLTGSVLVVVVAHYLVNALEFVLHEGLGLPDPVWS